MIATGQRCKTAAATGCPPRAGDKGRAHCMGSPNNAPLHRATGKVVIATGQRCKTAAATGCPPRRLSIFTVNAHCRAQRSKTVAVNMAGLLREWLTRARRDKAAGRMPVPAATDGAYTASCFFCKDISPAGASGATRWPAARCKNTCFALQYSPFHRPERCIPNDNTGRSAGGQGKRGLAVGQV